MGGMEEGGSWGRGWGDEPFQATINNFQELHYRGCNLPEISSWVNFRYPSAEQLGPDEEIIQTQRKQ